MGYRWQGHYFQRVDYGNVSDDITWYTPDGRAELYEWNSTDWDSPGGVYVEADRDSGSDNNRTTYEYAYHRNHQLTECTNPRAVESAGSSYLENTYDGSGRCPTRRTWA